MPRPNPRTNPQIAKTIGSQEQKSRAKAETAKDRTAEGVEALDSEDLPRNADGVHLVKVTMTAAELLPTGQFANVSVGPAQITAMIDPNQEENFTPEQKENIAKALNEMAEIVEVDVISVQRNLVLESIQDQVAENGSS